MPALAPRPSGDGIVRNTAFAFAVQLSTSVFTAILTIVLVRALEPEGYGLFALALSIGGLVLVPSDFGLSQAAARFVAERRGSPAGIAAVLATASGLSSGSRRWRRRRSPCSPTRSRTCTTPHARVAAAASSRSQSSVRA